MKVLLVSFSTLPVMQKCLYYSYDELAKRGVDVRTVGSSSLRIPFHPGGRNLVVDTPATPRPSIGSFRSSKNALDTVLGTIEDTQPDIIHFINKHMWNYLLMQRARSRRIDVKWVHTFHDPIGHPGDSVQRGVIAYHKLVRRLLDVIVVHSEIAETQTLEVLRPRCVVSRVQLGTTPWNDYQGIDASAARRLLVFGRLNRYKGCEMYPDIFNEIYRLDPSVLITVAGQPSKDLPNGLLDRIAACPNVNLEAHFIEEQALDQYFRAASLVLTPYTSMTQSAVVEDAFRNSRAVLAFQIDGMKEFLPSNAFTVPAFDTREYARVVVELLSDPVACARAGREAWEFGRRRFTPASMAASFAQIYEDILAPRP